MGRMVLRSCTIEYAISMESFDYSRPPAIQLAHTVALAKKKPDASLRKFVMGMDIVHCYLLHLTQIKNCGLHLAGLTALGLLGSFGLAEVHVKGAI